jgi:hypothetical protein
MKTNNLAILRIVRRRPPRRRRRRRLHLVIPLCQMHHLPPMNLMGQLFL